MLFQVDCEIALPIRFTFTPAMSSQPERREIYFTGRVQGVGFRYTARDIAADFAVAGFVRNLDDGRVHLIAEGELAVIDAFLTRLATRMQPNIRHVDERPGEPTGEFTAFEIRF
jgi:acylphosphatase